MKKATTITTSVGSETGRRGPAALIMGADIGSVSARGHRAASLRSAVGVRGRIPPGTSEGGTNKGTTMTASAGSETGRRRSATPVDANIELVAARGNRVAALRSLVGAQGRTPREARSAA